MKKERIFLVFVFLIILVHLSSINCAAGEFHFTAKENISLPTFHFYAIDILTKIKDSYLLLQVSKPTRTDIFKEIEDINRSLAKTSTCL